MHQIMAQSKPQQIVQGDPAKAAGHHCRHGRGQLDFSQESQISQEKQE